MTDEEFEKLLEEAVKLYMSNQENKDIEIDEQDFSNRHKKQMKKLFKRANTMSKK